MNDLCAKHDIKRHKNVPYTPQQNGIAEIMNLSILDGVRRMITMSDCLKDSEGKLHVPLCP